MILAFESEKGSTWCRACLSSSFLKGRSGFFRVEMRKEMNHFENDCLERAANMSTDNFISLTDTFRVAFRTSLKVTFLNWWSTSGFPCKRNMSVSLQSSAYYITLRSLKSEKGTFAI